MTRIILSLLAALTTMVAAAPAAAHRTGYAHYHMHGHVYRHHMMRHHMMMHRHHRHHMHHMAR